MVAPACGGGDEGVCYAAVVHSHIRASPGIHHHWCCCRLFFCPNVYVAFQSTAVTMESQPLASLRMGFGAILQRLAPQSADPHVCITAIGYVVCSPQCGTVVTGLPVASGNRVEALKVVRCGSRLELIESYHTYFVRSTEYLVTYYFEYY